MHLHWLRRKKRLLVFLHTKPTKLVMASLRKEMSIASRHSSLCTLVDLTKVIPRPVLIVGGPASGKHSVVRWLAAAWLT